MVPNRATHHILENHRARNTREFSDKVTSDIDDFTDEPVV